MHLPDKDPEARPGGQSDDGDNNGGEDRSEGSPAHMAGSHSAGSIDDENVPLTAWQRYQAAFRSEVMENPAIQEQLRGLTPEEVSHVVKTAYGQLFQK